MADPEKGPSYFGFVRDKRGLGVAEASVVLKPKDGDAIVVKSNVLGLYRTHVKFEARRCHRLVREERLQAGEHHAQDAGGRCTEHRDELHARTALVWRSEVRS